MEGLHLAAHGRRGLLLPGRPAPAGAPVVICDAGSPGASAARTVATELTGRSGRLLRVLVFAAEAEGGAARARAVEEELAHEPELDFQVVQRPAVRMPPLAELPEAKECGLLVLPADGPLAREELPDALETPEAPVLLVR